MPIRKHLDEAIASLNTMTSNFDSEEDWSLLLQEFLMATSRNVKGCGEVICDSCPSKNFPSLVTQIIQEMSRAVLVINMKGRFVYFNDQAMAILNPSSIMLPPEKWAEAYRIWAVDEDLKPIREMPTEELPAFRSLQNQESVKGSMALMKESGPTVLSVKSSPLYMGDKQYGCVVIFDVVESRDNS